MKKLILSMLLLFCFSLIGATIEAVIQLWDFFTVKLFTATHQSAKQIEVRPRQPPTKWVAIS